jgi:hypothetical protein
MTRGYAHDATERFIDALGDRWKIKQIDNDHYRAQCPAHNGDSLNLSITRLDQGARVKCFSHDCSGADIAEAVGLRHQDLFDRDGRATYDNGGGYVIHRHRVRTDRGEGKRIAPIAKGITPKIRPLWTPPTATATIAESDTIVIVEGEKCADAAVRLGAPCAVTWGGGTGSVGQVDLTPLQGKRVVVVPDRDEPGLKAGRKLVDRLQGIASAVQVMAVPETFGDWPGTLNDPADLWEAGGTLDDLVTIDLVAGVEDAPKTATKKSGVKQRELVATTLAAVEVTRQRWVVKDQMPEGVITIFAGVAGIAKSTILAWYVAALTNGKSDGDYAGLAVPVTIIAGEDDLGAQLVPRLKAAGANLALVTALEGVKITEGDESWTSSANLADDLAAIRAHLIKTGSKLLVIDPIISLMSGDSHRLDDVRRNLDPLHQLANDLGIAVVCVAHFSKGAGRAGEKVSGSHAFRDIARSLLVLAVDEETDERILTVEKSNYSQAKPSFAFIVDSVTVPTGGGDLATVGCARMVGESNVTVQDLLDRDTTVLGDRSAELVKYVNAHPEGVTGDDVAAEFSIEANQARTYLSRAATAGRITRVRRGVYGPKRNTNATPPQAVMSVASVAMGEKATHITHATPLVAVANTVANETIDESDDLIPDGWIDPGYHAHPCGRTLDHLGQCPKCGPVELSEVSFS